MYPLPIINSGISGEGTRQEGGIIEFLRNYSRKIMLFGCWSGSTDSYRETRPRLSRVVDLGLRKRGNNHADRNLRHHAVI
jgi:hypothetical protein